MYGFKPGAKPEEKAPKGKKIVGPGTGTSDSIPAKIPKGSYIMPADSTKQIGQPTLDALGKPVPVKVSNGEYQMPPEQVHAVGVQTLNQMRDATHMPVAAGFKPQKDGLYFADGGLIADAAQYWANDNEQFEAGNPSFGSRVVRALNPATSFGSAMGAMHTAAGSGDKTGMALAAAQAIPVFGAMRPAMGAVKAARAMVPSAARTGAAIAGNGAAGAMADAYGSPAVAAEPQQPGVAFSDMQREPNIPRREEPRLGFADGGSPAEEERKRLAGTGPSPQMGAVALGEQRRAERAGGSGFYSQANADLGRAASTAFPNTATAIRGAGQNIAEAYQVGGFPAAAGATVRNMLVPAIGFAADVGRSAKQALDPFANALKTAVTGDPTPIEGSRSPAAQPAPAATTQATSTPTAPASAPEAQGARAGYGFTPDPMQGPALGMRVSPTSAPEINRIDNAPGLNSPLFTNLPTGEAVSGMQGGTVNTMPASAFTSAGPQASRAVSAALQAAAARGDWDAVRGFYQQNGGTWQGRTAQQDAAESQGPRGGVIGGSGRGFNFVRRSEERAADRAQADRRLSREEALARDRLDIDRQRAESEAQTRGFEVRGMERVERLYQQLEAAETPEARAAIAEQIRALSGKDTPNRYTVVPGGQEYDAAAGMVLNRPAMVLNNQTGQPVDLGGAQASRAAMPPPNHIDALKKNPNQAAQFDAIYGEGAAARYLGAN
jgi:hypothetical protein